MNVTEWAAWVGAVTGLVGLGWNVYLKLSSGHRIIVSAWADMVQAPSRAGNPRFLRITVQNIGTVPTTLTNVTFHAYQSKSAARKQRAEWNVVMNAHQGPKLPRVLGIGEEWSTVMQQDARLDDALNEGHLWCAVHHSFSQKPVQATVIRTGHPSAATE